MYMHNYVVMYTNTIENGILLSLKQSYTCINNNNNDNYNN